MLPSAIRVPPVASQHHEIAGFIALLVFVPLVGIGLIAGGLMLLLAITSYDAARKAMGVWWGRLHKLNYVLAILAGVHVWQYRLMSLLPIVDLTLQTYVTAMAAVSTMLWWLN